ncbi:MAG: class I SAM-dependent methyltransferase [Planctomycetes bacterium]|nr:class I SAM-dependent methyltransferase [Planctomycetota bacterium]
MPPLDLAAVTNKQKQAWGTGDFNVFALKTMAVAESLCAALDPRSGQKVLDVATGSGNAALVAARRHCDVTGIDFAPSLVERAKLRATAEGTPIDFREADAQALPFPDGSFDVVTSVFGVMFAPDQEKAAAELLRVTKPGGKIGLATWAPDGFGGDFFKTVRTYAPPPEGLKPPTRWGTEAGLKELLGGGVTSLAMEKETFFQHYRSMEHLVHLFETYFGPVAMAASKLDDAGRVAMRKDLAACFAKYNRGTDGTLVLECGYVQTTAVRKPG